MVISIRTSTSFSCGLVSCRIISQVILERNCHIQLATKPEASPVMPNLPTKHGLIERRPSWKKVSARFHAMLARMHGRGKPSSVI